MSWFSKKIGKSDLIQQQLDEGFSARIVGLIMENPLVSFEDADFLVNMFDNRFSTDFSELSWPEVSPANYALGGIAFAAAMLSKPRLPWLLRTPTLLFTGYNILQAIRLKMNQSRYVQLLSIIDEFRAMLNILHELCLSINKTVQFIQEMELIDRGFTLPNLVTHLSVKTIPNHPSALLCLPLRGEVMAIINGLHSLARQSTLDIRNSVPLGSSVDNPSHYLACADPPVIEFDNNQIPLQTIKVSLRKCNLQVSEMLRRLALCFLVPLDQHRSCPVTTFNNDMSQHIKGLSQSLQLSFDYYSSWKVIDKEEKTCQKADKSQGLEIALHCLERHLRASALIVNNPLRQVDSLDWQIQLKHECQAIATCWDLFEAEQKKLATPHPAKITNSTQQVIGKAAGTVASEGEPLPLYGEWVPPHIQDEILEADLANELAVELSDDQDEPLVWETRQQRLARKKEMASQAKRLYSELQLVLRSKADEWKEREAKVMQRLGKTVPIQQEAEQNPSTMSEATEMKTVAADGEASDMDSLNCSVTQETVSLDTAKFVTSTPYPSNFSVQASLASQVRLLASQRILQHEDIIGDSDDEEDENDDDDGMQSVQSTTDSSFEEI